MLTGKKYGWYLGTFLYFFDIMRRLNATFSVFQAASIYGDVVWNSPRVAMSIIGDIGGVVVDFFIIGYFFRDYVLAYFKLEGILKWRTVGMFFGVAVLIYVISSLLNALA